MKNFLLVIVAILSLTNIVQAENLSKEMLGVWCSTGHSEYGTKN